jgi:hypothetical protein
MTGIFFISRREKPQIRTRPLPSTTSSINYSVIIILLVQKVSLIEKKLTPWLLVRKLIIPTEQPPLVGEVSVDVGE